jgi:hypothetical protein
VDDLQPVLVKALEHALGRRRTADHEVTQRAQVPPLGVGLDRLEDRHPHRGHAGGDRHLLVSQQIEHRLGVHPRAGEHEAGPDERRGVDQAPRVGVEHRDDGQQRVAPRDVLDVGQGSHQRMQDLRAV